MKWVNRLGQWIQVLVLDARASRRRRRLKMQYNDPVAKRQLRSLQKARPVNTDFSEADEKRALSTSEQLVDSVFDTIKKQERNVDKK